MGKRKSKAGKFVVFIIIVCIIIFILFKFGILGNPIKKIVKAATNTLDQYQMLEDLDVSKYTEDSDYHADIKLGANNNAIDLRYDVKDSVSQLAFEKDFNLAFLEMNLNIITQMENGTIKVQVPTIGDNVYNYSSFDDSQIAFVQEVGALKLNNSGKILLLEQLAKYKFKKIDAKDCIVSDKKTECDGYKTTVDCSELCEVYKEFLDTYSEEELKLMRTLRGSDVESEVMDVLKKMGTVNISLYMTEDVIAEIIFEPESTNDKIDIVMDSLAENENLSVYINNKTLVSLIYDTSSKEMKACFDDEGKRNLIISIRDSDSSKILQFVGVDSVACLMGNIDALKSVETEDSLMGTIISGILKNTDVNLEISISDNAQITELQGDQLSVEGKSALTIIEVLNDVLETVISNL